ncbi:hypothetical protein [Laceyella sediminis]|uniref:hypothetical protein n=1 Tax=Laceyella sediminis TaxID=573074 RepID=UPI0011B1DFC4|nr:hypothetical protein [Laceyella sediminis]
MFTQHDHLRRTGQYLLPVLLPLSVGFMLGLKLDFRVEQSLLLIVFYLLLFILFMAALFILAVYKQWVSAGALFIVIMMSVSSASGYLVASNQVEYLVARKGNATYAVVDVYKESLVLMPVDLKKRTVKPEYLFVDHKTELQAAMQLQKKRIGPLTLEQ